MRILFIALLALSCLGQSVPSATYTAGSSGEPPFSPSDCAFSPAGAPTVSLPCSGSFFDASMPIPTLRYGYGGSGFAYAIPWPNGPAVVTLTFVEPNKTAGGQRLFAVRVAQSPELAGIDVYRLAGGQKKAVDQIFLATVTDGVLRIAFRAQLGNAMVSRIRVDLITGPQGPAGPQGPIGPEGPQGPKGDPGTPALARWLTCWSPGTCNGLQFVEVRRSDGTLTQLLAVPTPQDFAFPALDNPDLWKPVQP